MDNVKPCSADEAIEAIKRGEHLDAASYRDPQTDRLLIDALRKGTIRAGWMPDGKLAFTR